MSASRVPRRRLVVAILVALGIVGIVADDPDPVRSDVLPAPVEEAVVMPPAALSSSAWFCAGGVPGNVAEITEDDADESEPGPVGDVVYVTNTTARDASVRVTALSALAGAPRARRYPVAAGRSVTIPVADLSREPDAAMMVEPFADGIVVEEQVGAPGRDDVALAPCATQTSSNWYFAAGSTVKGSSQWLSLLNPYSADAVVDVTLITNDEVRRPSELQSLVVGARSRTSVYVNDAADRKTIVALAIAVQDGRRIVAQQTVIHRNVAGRSGVSSTIGAVSPATRFTFANGARRTGNSRLLFIMNPGVVPTDVDIQIATEGDGGASPTTISLDAQSVRTVNLNKLVPTGSRYAVVVHAAADLAAGTADRVSDRGIVVEDFEGFRIETRARSVFGVAGGIGGIQPSTEWRFGRNSLGGDATGQLAFYNPNESAATVDVSFVVGGEIVEPDDVQQIVVEGASSIVVRIDGIVDADAGIIVRADRTIYVERLLVAGETATRSLGVRR